MPKRFVFRQVQYQDIDTFLRDGMICPKNYVPVQRCHSASNAGIVARRGTNIYDLPYGGTANDYVPFYFSPKTAFTYSLHMGNVNVHTPDGQELGPSRDEERVFFVCDVENFAHSNLQCCFSDIAANCCAPLPTFECDFAKLEQHIAWSLFDEPYLSAPIPEIGYLGVHSWFRNEASPERYQKRSQQRMAEFLVHGPVPLGYVTCLIVKTERLRQHLQPQIDAYDWPIPIYVKPGCYF